MNLTFQQLRIGDKFRLKGGPTVYTKTGTTRADSVTAGHANTQFTDDHDIPVDYYVDARLAIKPEHYWELREKIEPWDTPERRALYIDGNFPKSANTKNVAMRYRWDLMYSVPGLNQWTCDALYPYLDDEQIDSAMRHILGMGHETKLRAK